MQSQKKLLKNIKIQLQTLRKPLVRSINRWLRLIQVFGQRLLRKKLSKLTYFQGAFLSHWFFLYESRHPSIEDIALIILFPYSFRALIALLFHHIEMGQRSMRGNARNITIGDRDLGLKATGLYFVLLSIPGSSAFNIFHPMLYNKALDSFKLAVSLQKVSLKNRIMSFKSFDRCRMILQFPFILFSL